MKKSYTYLILFVLLTGMYGCSSSGENNSKEEQDELDKVDAMLRKNEERADSMKRALGIGASEDSL